MKTWLIAAAVAGMAASFVPFDVEAKRLGGGKSSGMQREMPTRSAPDAPPARPAAPAQAAPATAAAPAAGTAAAASRPGWLAPVAGLAAGLGLAALATHLGFGEGLANVLMLLLLGVAAFFLVRLLMRTFGGSAARPAAAGAGAAGGTAAPRDWPRTEPTQPLQRTAAPSAPAMSPDALPAASTAGMQHLLGPSIPADFDREGFERIAKMIFIRMQAAHDAGDLNDLRQFTTPEMFASVRLDLQDRGAAANHTDVVRVDAEVLDVAQEGERQIVSVRFHGLIREEQGAAEQDFDEVWHLVKADESSAWAIAGIQQHA
jgi:predicted lipid-binding transport protein (Tim44 family)